MTDTNAVVAVCDTHSAAEEAVKDLQKSGFDMKKLSIVGKDFLTDEQVLWGLLFGAASFWGPSIGPILIGGPLVAWVVAGLEGAVAVGGLSAIGAGLYSMGFPKNGIMKYETDVKADKYLIVVHGTAGEAAKAKDILRALKPSGLTEHVLEPAAQAVSS